MGIRRKHGKNKKMKRSGAAVAVRREETVRRGARDAAKPRTQGMR
jgi:hypothetical protein